MASALSYIQRDGCDSHRNVDHPLETRDFQERTAQQKWSLERQTGSDRFLTEQQERQQASMERRTCVSVQSQVVKGSGLQSLISRMYALLWS